MKARSNKTGLNFMMFILIFLKIVCNTMVYVHNFSVWLRTDSNLSDINRLKCNLQFNIPSVPAYYQYCFSSMASKPIDISGRLEPVLSITEKSCIASNYSKFSTNDKMKITILLPVLLNRASGLTKLVLIL